MECISLASLCFSCSGCDLYLEFPASRLKRDLVAAGLRLENTCGVCCGGCTVAFDLVMGESAQ